MEKYEAVTYDLTDAKQVIALAKDMGDEFKTIIPLVHAMPDEMKVVFFTALLGPTFGIMGAAIGMNASKAVVETCVNLTQRAADASAAARH